MSVQRVYVLLGSRPKKHNSPSWIEAVFADFDEANTTKDELSRSAFALDNEKCEYAVSIRDVIPRKLTPKNGAAGVVELINNHPEFTALDKDDQRRVIQDTLNSIIG